MGIIGRRNKWAIFVFLVICNDGTSAIPVFDGSTLLFDEPQ